MSVHLFARGHVIRVCSHKFQNLAAEMETTTGGTVFMRCLFHCWPLLTYIFPPVQLMYVASFETLKQLYNINCCHVLHNSDKTMTILTLFMRFCHLFGHPVPDTRSCLKISPIQTLISLNSNFPVNLSFCGTIKTYLGEHSYMPAQVRGLPTRRPSYRLRCFYI